MRCGAGKNIIWQCPDLDGKIMDLAERLGRARLVDRVGQGLEQLENPVCHLPQKHGTCTMLMLLHSKLSLRCMHVRGTVHALYHTPQVAKYSK